MNSNYREEAAAWHNSAPLLPSQASLDPQFPQFKRFPEEIRCMIWEIALLQLEFIEVEGSITSKAHQYNVVNFHVSWADHQRVLTFSKAFFCHEPESYVKALLKTKGPSRNDDPIILCPNLLDLCMKIPWYKARAEPPTEFYDLAIYLEEHHDITGHVVRVLTHLVLSSEWFQLQTLYLILKPDEAFYMTELSIYAGFTKAPSLPPLQGHFDEREAILQLYYKALNLKTRINDVLEVEVKIVQWKRPGYSNS